MIVSRKYKVAEPSGAGGSTTIRGGCQVFKLSRVIELHGVLSDIDKRHPAFYDGKDTGDEFVTHDVYDRHFRFSLGQSACIVLPHLGISMNGAHGGQMEHPFHVVVGHGADFRSSPDARAGLIVERRNATVAGELAPVVESCEVVCVYTIRLHATIRPMPLMPVTS